MHALAPTGQPLPTMAVVSVTNFISCIPAFALIDRYGRRPLLKFGALGMCVAMFIESVLSYAINSTATEHDALEKLVFFLGGMLLFVGTFSATWGVVVWVVASELVPLRHHAWGLSAATSTNWACNAAVAYYAANVSVTIAFSSFAVACAVAAVYVHRYLPETSAISLENIGVVFGPRALLAARDGGGGGVHGHLHQMGAWASPTRGTTPAASPAGSRAELPVPFRRSPPSSQTSSGPLLHVATDDAHAGAPGFAPGFEHAAAPAAAPSAASLAAGVGLDAPFAFDYSAGPGSLMASGDSLPFPSGGALPPLGERSAPPPSPSPNPPAGGAAGASGGGEVGCEHGVTGGCNARQVGFRECLSSAAASARCRIGIDGGSGPVAPLRAPLLSPGAECAGAAAPRERERKRASDQASSASSSSSGRGSMSSELAAPGFGAGAPSAPHARGQHSTASAAAAGGPCSPSSLEPLALPLGRAGGGLAPRAGSREPALHRLARGASNVFSGLGIGSTAPCLLTHCADCTLLVVLFTLLV